MTESADHSGLLVVVSGPSGVGKTTITRAVQSAFDDSALSVSVTTRPRAPGDRDGVDYFFVDRPEFERMREASELLESAEVFGNCYGTPRAWVEARLAERRLVILEIDVQGAEQIKTHLPEMYGIFVLPPSEEVLLERLRARRRDPEEVIARRFAEAKREMARARAGDAYDAFIVNDDLGEAVDEAVALVRARRLLA